ncbi:MAG TPA: PKD domain-containing protein, partial [Thermoanaerobaculia bacterium]|nr:PKD domain-containing protein [Thermoanaerobaculia bacterium]
VYYTADGNGPVTLTLQTWTEENCTATTTASQPLRETTPPVIQFEAADVCPTGPGIAWTEMTHWDRYSWSITNGVLTSSPTNSYVYYTADGTGPVTLTLQTWTEENCTATTTASQPLRATTPPAIQFEDPEACANGTGTAWTDTANWDRYSWSIANGTLTSSPTNSYVYYTADGNGPVTLTLQTWTQENCTATATASQPLRTVDPPTILGGPQPDVCPGGTSSAYVPDTYDTYTWSIQHGVITSTSADQKSVMFTADGSGPVVVSVLVSKDSCTSSSSITVPLRTIDPPVLLGGPQPNVCPGGTSSAYVPDTYDTYTWSIQHGTITSTSADQKSVMFTADGSGPVVVSVLVSKDSCTSSSSITVPLRTIDPPVLLGGPQPNVCPGGTSSAYVPDDYDTYTWSIQNGTITSTSADQKSVMYTADGSGDVVVSVTVSKDSCTSTNSLVVPLRTVEPATITPSGPTTFCEGGSVTLTANEAASYLWSTGATTPSITVTASGSYSVTTTGSSGCPSTSEPVQVTVDPAVSATITAADALCEGSTGTATVPDAGAGASYAWSIANGTIVSGNGTSAISFSAAGSGPVQLGVTVTRGSCTASSSKTVAVNPRPVFSILASPYQSYELRDGEESMLRAEGEEGSTADATFDMCGVTQVQLRASVLNGSWSYVWSTGATGPFLVVSSSGTYTLTATNANGCVWTDTATVNLKPMPVATISGSGTFCPGGSTTLTAAGGSSYLWSTGATTPSITVSTAGTYSVQVTQDGCTATASKSVVQSAAAITADGPTTFCHGGSVTLTANPAQSYLWSNGATTQSITVTSSGTFTVQETFDGCTLTSDPVAVSVGPSAVSVSVDDTAACPGQTLHYTSMVTGGTNLTYEWLDGNGALLGNGPTLDLVPPDPGYYSVSLRVTDANGCQLTSEPRVIYRLTPVKPVITYSAPSTTFCESGNITLESSPASSYLWSTGETTRWITVAASGSYSVTTTDASGCTATSDPVQVTVLPRPPQPAIAASGPLTFCEGGSVTLTGPDGYAQYLWSTGETTQSITVSTSRWVALTVINEAGCDNTSEVQVTVLPRPVASIAASGPTTFCEGGSVTLTAPAGHTYLWSTGATTQSIAVGATGSYSVTITNANGCSASASTSVTVNPLPATPTITASGPLAFCEGGSVTLTAPESSSYAWSTGATTRSITVNASGAYSVTVTNANGCSASSAPATVTVNALPSTPNITASGATTFCEGGSVTLTAPDGYAYAWSTGATTQSITVNASGSYSVTITNANGCSASASTSVTVNPLPATPTITASGPTTFCEGGSVTLTAPAGYSYAWSNGATTQSITVNASGAYSVTITNANGCSASASTSVTVNPLPSTPTITASGPTTFCEGGSVTLTAPAGYSYAWSNGATTQSITVNASGSYSVTVTNANGCSATSAPTTVNANALPSTPTITANGPTTFCEGGSVTLTAPAGYSYAWSNGATTQSITVNASGAYSVTVTNASGCSATSAPTTVTVNAKPSTPAVTANGPTTFCEGGSVTLTAPAGYSYAWSHGATTQSITVNASGAYSVTVTNANGCSATSAPATVTVNPKPATPAVTASGSTALCPGASVTLTAPAGFTYLWSNGATTQSITVSTAGSYSVTVTNANGCSATSAPTTVTTYAATTITAQPQSITMPRNVTRVLSVTASGTALTYQWYQGFSGDTTQPLVGQTSSTYTVGPFPKKGTHRYWVRVSSATCPASTVNSATAVVTVN